MSRQENIKTIKDILERLSVNNFTGTVEISFRFGGVSSVIKTEKLALDEAKK